MTGSRLLWFLAFMGWSIWLINELEWPDSGKWDVNNDPKNIDLSGGGLGKKSAYENHYKGTLFYKKEEFKKANHLFQKAYSSASANFYFATSYAISLAQTGNPKKGLKILEKSTGLLHEHQEDYEEQRALLHFFQGMAYIYTEQFGQAVPSLRRAIEYVDVIDKPYYKSLFYNALGYATLLNQGRGAHTRAEIAAHYHIHTRDMIRAMAFFEESLMAFNGNVSAWHNYSIICDSLDIKPKVTFDSTMVYEGQNVATESSFIHLPANILKAFELETYEEVAMLLDNSGSMVQEKVKCQDTTRFSVMKSTAMEMVNKLPESVALGVGTIGGDCDQNPRLWSASGQRTRKDLRWDIEFLVPDGTTPLLTMLQRSPTLFEGNRKTRKTIFLVSDGANVCSAKGVDICEWVEGLGKMDITINVLTFLNASFSNTDAFAEYSCLADKTGGAIMYLDDLRCNVKYHPTSLVAYCQPKIPELRKVDCWGRSFENLWAIFPNG